MLIRKRKAAMMPLQLLSNLWLRRLVAYRTLAHLIVLAVAQQALNERQVARLDGVTVVQVVVSVEDGQPALVTLAQVQACGKERRRMRLWVTHRVPGAKEQSRATDMQARDMRGRPWKQQLTGHIGDGDQGQDHTGQTAESADPELGAAVHKAEHNTRNQRAGLADGSREAVAHGAKLGRRQLGGQQPGGGVGAELAPETGEVVQELERVDVLGSAQLIVVHGADEEQNKLQGQRTTRVNDAPPSMGLPPRPTQHAGR